MLQTVVFHMNSTRYVIKYVVSYWYHCREQRQESFLPPSCNSLDFQAYKITALQLPHIKKCKEISPYYFEK